MTLETIHPPKRPRGRALGIAALLAAPFLLLATTASADRERGLATQDSARVAPAPEPRSAPAPDVSRSPSPSASAPSRGPASSDVGVSRGGTSRGGSRDGVVPRSSSSSGGGHGYVVTGPRGPVSVRHPRPHRRYHAPSIRYGTSWWWGGPWDWWWWGGGWGPYWGRSGVVVIDEWNPLSGRYARVDTDVSPEAAEVFLDGTYIGSADDFDGLPDYLYLEPGRYRLEFRHPSYETLVKEVQARRGQELRIRDDLKLLPGKGRMDAFDPEHRGTPLGRVFGKPDAEGKDRDRTGRFEPRVRPERPKADPDDEEEALEELEEAEEPEEVAEPEDVDEDEDLREPVRPARPAPPAAPRDSADEPVFERGRLRFDVEPADAAVYVDDRYVGTGEELSGLRRGFPVRPGKHTVTVVRPGFAAKAMDVEVKSGASIDVVVELEK